MGIRKWAIDLFTPFKKDGELSNGITFSQQLTAEIYYKKLAIETAINLIANTLALAEFRTFENGKDVKKSNYYLFNIEPNQNQNANKFWREVIHNLVYENRALVVMHDNKLYVAEDFEKTNYSIKPNVYSKVRIKDLVLEKTFLENQVFHFELHSERMQDLINRLYADYGKLIEYSKSTYKRSNARRGVLDIPTSFPTTTQAQEKLEKLLTVNMKSFFNAENGALLPLTNGIKYQDLTNQTYKNGSDSRDIRSLIDDVFDYVAIAFQIPPQLLKGSVADSDKSFDNFMAFCIRPWAELLEKEINRKYYGINDFLEKTYLKIDLSLIKEMSLKDIAYVIDMLTRNGVNTLNDNLRLLGKEEENEIGDLRFITLNLATIDNVMKGGD